MTGSGRSQEHRLSLYSRRWDTPLEPTGAVLKLHDSLDRRAARHVDRVIDPTLLDEIVAQTGPNPSPATHDEIGPQCFSNTNGRFRRCGSVGVRGLASGRKTTVRSISVFLERQG
jgi:hypothetical protein